MIARYHYVVHLTLGILRVFRPFSWLEVCSVKAALSRLTHQRVTLTVIFFIFPLFLLSPSIISPTLSSFAKGGSS